MGSHHGVQGWWKTWWTMGPTQSGHWCFGGCNACYNFTGLMAHLPWTYCSYSWFKAVSSIRITMVCRTYPTILKPRKILQGRACVRMTSNYSRSSNACISAFSLMQHRFYHVFLVFIAQQIADEMHNVRYLALLIFYLFAFSLEIHGTINSFLFISTLATAAWCRWFPWHDSLAFLHQIVQMLLSLCAVACGGGQKYLLTQKA